MGCGRQYTNKGSPEIVIIRSDLAEEPEVMQNPELLSIRQSFRPFEHSSLTSFLSSDRMVIEERKNDEFDDFSKISVKGDDAIKVITFTFKSPVEVIQNREDLNSKSITFNFEFLNESSGMNSDVQKMIDEVLREFTSEKEIGYVN